MATELTEDRKDEMNIDNFDQYHQLSLLNGGCNINETERIVSILGGIDNVLTNYINITKNDPNNELLNKNQMLQIYDMISQDNVDINDEFQGDDDDDTDDENVTYYFEINNTFYHSIFNDEIVNKISNILLNKYFVSINLIISALWLIPTSILNNDKTHKLKWFFIFEMIGEIWIIIYLLSLILLCNKKVFYLIAKTFDFWIKTYYAMGYMIANSIYIRCLNYIPQKQLYIDLSSVIILLLVILFSTIEGMHTSWKKIVFMGVIMSAFVSISAVKFTFWFEKQTNTVELIPGTGMALELFGYWTACNRILSLFLWKQTLMTAYTRGKSCISLYESPNIKWITNKVQDNVDKIVN